MHPPNERRAILIAGPTASGKSQLAIDLAGAVDGVVINADSMQVYSELRILTARPSPEDELLTPHALFGFQPGATAYSVGRFVSDCEMAIQVTLSEGRVPIVVGGTGLYFRALLDGLAPIPPVPDYVRAHWRGEMELRGAAELHKILARRDPEMAAALNPADSQRIVRALEVIDATGRSLKSWQMEKGRPALNAEATIQIVLDVERERLHERARLRLAQMVEAGVVEEVRGLMALGLSPDLPIMRAVGVASFAAHLTGRLTLEDAMQATLAETRAYIKRQETWARGQMSTWTRLKAADVPAFLAAIATA